MLHFKPKRPAILLCDPAAPAVPKSNRRLLKSVDPGNTEATGVPIRRRFAYDKPMAIISDEAIVLARLDYSETSQIIVLFTRAHGKVRAIAKGIKRGTKKRFAVGMDLLDTGHVVVSSRQDRTPHLATVTEWKQIRCPWGLRQKLFRIHAAQYAIEITSHLTEDWDPHPDLFDALEIVLDTLSETSEPLAPVVSYQLRLLESIGSLPRFDACVLCGRTGDLTHFSSFEGGTICRDCEPRQVEKWEVSNATLGLLGGDKGFDPARLRPPAPSPAAAYGLLNYHVSHLMGREPRLASKVAAPAVRRRID